DRVLRHVSAPRHQRDLSFKILLAGPEHFCREIDRAVASGFWTNHRTAPGQTLPCHHTGELVLQSLVHPEHESDLTRADADIARRDVRIWSDMPEQLAHECLTETHHFKVSLSFGIEVRRVHCAYHLQGIQCVLIYILKGELIKVLS